MKKIILLILVIIPFLCLETGFANAPTPIQQGIFLKKYYDAKCEDLIGTWKGTFTDPQDLFGNGGPWPIEVALTLVKNRIVGQTNASKAPDYVRKAATGNLWAICEKGELKNIFLGEKNQCGSFSQSGALISKNQLIFTVNYENAMIGTKFIVILSRVNNRFPYNIPKEQKHYQLDHVSSCH